MTARDIAPEQYSGNPPETKVCATCNQSKATSLFPKDAQRKDGLRPNCKDCRSKQGKATYARTRKKVLARQKAAYANDPARVREYHRHWYGENKASKLAKSKQWKAENRDTYRVQQREYVEQNRAAANRKSKEWVKRNPEKRRAITRHHNSMRRSAYEGGASPQAVAAWFASQSMTCFYCKKDCSDRPEVDHFYPLSRGGKHDIENLRICCVPCNRRKSARDPHEFMRSRVA